MIPSHLDALQARHVRLNSYHNSSSSRSPELCPEEAAPGAGLRDSAQARLIAAASRGDLEAIGRALSGPAPRLDLDHPLRLAAKHRHGDAVRLLLGCGANIVRAFSPRHTPVRYGKRVQLVDFLATCDIDAQFILELPRPHGPTAKRRARQRRNMRAGEGGPDRVRARQALAKREAWVARRDALRMRRVLKNHNGLLAEILATVSSEAEDPAHLEHAVRSVLFEHGITDHRRRLSSVIVHKLYGEGYVPAPAAHGVEGV